MPFAWGMRAQCQSCFCFASCSVDGTVQLGEWEHGHCHSLLIIIGALGPFVGVYGRVMIVL